MSTPVDMYLSSYNATVTLDTSYSWDAVAATVPSTDATATLYIKTSTMKNMFNLAVDGIDVADIDDASGNGIWFLIDASSNITTIAQTNLSDANNHNIWKVNEMSAYVTSGAITSTQVNGIELSYNEIQIPQDYARYVSQELFGNSYVADLFANEKAVSDKLYLAGRDELTTEHMAKILSLDIGHAANFARTSLTAAQQASITNNGYAGTDASGNQYTTNAWDSTHNIGLTLLRQLKHHDPPRFANYFDVTSSNYVGYVTGTNGQSKNRFLMNFIDGDSINYVLTLSPPAEQHNLINGSAIANRTYLVKHLMVSDSDYEAFKNRNVVDIGRYADIIMHGYSSGNPIELSAIGGNIPDSEIGL